MLIIGCSADPVQRCSNTAKAGKAAAAVICQFCSLHAVKRQWFKLVMSFNVMEQLCPLCIKHSDEARFHLCFMPSVNNIIRCGAHSCSTCECVSVCVEHDAVSGQWHFVCVCVCVSSVTNPAHLIWNETAKRWNSRLSVLFCESVLFLLGKNAGNKQ